MAPLRTNFLPALRRAAGRIARGPRLPATTVAEFVREHPQRWFEAFPAQPLPGFAPVRWGTIERDFDISPAAHGPLGLVDLSGGGAIVGLAGWAMSPDHRLLKDVGWFEMRDIPERRPRLRYPTDHLSGQCLSVAADCAKDNYAHFLLESLPRLGIAATAGFEPAAWDRIIVAPLPRGIPASLLAQAGLDPERLAFTRIGRRLSADRLFATTFPGRPADYPVSTVQYLRSLVPNDGSPRNRRLFVRRFGIRELSNEAELLAIAQRYGFEAYDYRENSNPPRDFAAARIVAGSHSATLANVAFCEQGTGVFEIIPTDHVRAYYCTLARAAGHRYHYMAGKSAIERPAGAVGEGRSPVSVDPSVFEAGLKHLVDQDGGAV